MNTANYLTLLRIFISPLFLFLYMYPTFFGISSTGLPYVLITLLGISELSDAVDGWIARRFNQVTDLGKLLDPMADSVHHIAVFLTFTEAPVNLPMWVVLLFLFRDSFISTLRTMCALKGFALAARLSGKLKAVLQGLSAFAILLLMIPYSLGNLSGEDLTLFSTIIAATAGAWALISGIDYIFASRQYITPSFKLSK